MNALHAPLLGHAVAALQVVLEFDASADAALSRYLRAHPVLGQNDRAFVAEAVFTVLRHLRSLEAACAGRDARRLVLSALVRVRAYPLARLSPLLHPEETRWLAQTAARAADAGPAVECEFPDWIYERLLRQYGADEIRELARSLLQTAPLDLRVNALKTKREAVLARFAAEGIGAQATPYAPEGIRLDAKTNISRHALYREGMLEIQDEGSQLLCELLAPRRGEMVADFCAGAGGKTLALGARMRASGRLYAIDVAEKRLAALKPRLERSGLGNVHALWIANESDARLQRLGRKLDRVLVDAPCSGLGTLRRNPDRKWRLHPGALEEYRAAQARILSAASALVRPGGALLYATCSLLEEENEAIVREFMATHPEYSLRPASAELRRRRIALDTGEFLRLLPHRHGTDGFFAALMARAAR